LAATGEPTTFTTLGLVRSSALLISAASVPMSTAGSASGASAAVRSDGAAWAGRPDVDDDCGRVLRVGGGQRLEDPIRAGA
jgi:hypothetical protein